MGSASLDRKEAISENFRFLSYYWIGTKLDCLMKNKAAILAMLGVASLGFSKKLKATQLRGSANTYSPRSLQGLKNASKNRRKADDTLELEIDYYRLENIPEDILRFKNLKVLKIINAGGLTELPNFFSKMKSLQSLEIFSSQITTFPTVISEMDSLIRLIMPNSPLTDFNENPNIANFLNKIGAIAEQMELGDHNMHLNANEVIFSTNFYGVDDLSFQFLYSVGMNIRFIHAGYGGRPPGDLTKLGDDKIMHLIETGVPRGTIEMFARLTERIEVPYQATVTELLKGEDDPISQYLFTSANIAHYSNEYFEKAIQILPKFKNLHSISIWSDTDFGERKVKIPVNIDQLKNLQHLKLYNLQQVSGFENIKGSEHVPVHLRLSKIENIIGLNKLNSPSVRYISIEDSPNFTHIPEEWSDLKNLRSIQIDNIGGYARPDISLPDNLGEFSSLVELRIRADSIDATSIPSLLTIMKWNSMGLHSGIVEFLLALRKRYKPKGKRNAIRSF
jgi:hypothetical protein